MTFHEVLDLAVSWGHAYERRYFKKSIYYSLNYPEFNFNEFAAVIAWLKQHGNLRNIFLSTADQSLAHEFTSFYFPCNEHCHPTVFILKVLIFSVRHWLLKLITFQTKFFFFNWNWSVVFSGFLHTWELVADVLNNHLWMAGSSGIPSTAKIFCLNLWSRVLLEMFLDHRLNQEISGIL